MKLDIKRFNIYKDIDVLCPCCDTDFTIESGSEYISYPETEQVNKLFFCCQECGEGLEIDVFIRLNVTPQPCSIKKQ